MSLNEQFEAWSKAPPDDLDGDPIWRLPAFRIGLFLSPIIREDAARLAGDPHHARVVDQLLRSIDSIAANIAEGYARYSGRERARFYEIAMGSAREARVWYRALSHSLGESVVRERTLLLTRVVKILSKAIPEERELTITRTRRPR